MKIDLSGKTALITGASGQLGRVMTRTLAQCGANVVVHYYRNKSKAEELLAEIKAMGVGGCTVQADVTDAESVMQMQRFVAENLGDPDIIVNNSVILYKWATVMEQPIEDYESQYKSSILHNVLMAKAFVPAMIKKGWGRVIGINTECSMACAPHQSAYISGKRGMDGVLRVLAKEIGEHDITVNQVAPGWVITEKERADGPNVNANKEYISMVPLKRRGTDQDVANAVAFLASDLSAFITGLYVPIAGGKCMPRI
ncbi:MAG: SDR family oxidoreductase [Planctomycetota bacterium]|nr:SDR family oxidoreductase [Planctomycetota bacterium]